MQMIEMDTEIPLQSSFLEFRLQIEDPCILLFYLIVALYVLGFILT